MELKLLKRFFIAYTAFSFFVFSVFPAFAFDVSVSDGNASVSQSGNTTTINVKSNAVLQGNTSIAANQIVNIIGSSNVLLRDTTGSSTNWLGSLLSQGNVVLINTNGIYIAKAASINVQSLIASTLDIQNEAFLSGQYNFQKVNGTNVAKILNEANITVKDGGYLVLIADQVKNSGTITAYMGSVAFGSGQNVTISFDQNGLVNLVVNQGLVQQLTGSDGLTLDQIINKGKIQADGGRVQMTAKLLETTLKSIVNNEGVIEANRAVNQNGVVTFVADGGIENKGTISATKLNEQGYTFHSSGKLDVGHGYFDNLDGAIAIAGNISGTYSDVGNIDFVGGVTLTGDTVLQADSGSTNAGEIVMNGNSLTGNNYDLTLDASYSGDAHVDTLSGVITGVNIFNLNSSSGAAETFVSTGGAFNVQTLQTNNNSLFSRSQGMGTPVSPYMIYSDSNVQGGLEYISTLGLSKYYELANNINAPDTSSWNAGAGFVPIGTIASPFTGTFLGNTKTIDGLFIDRSSTDNIGLFGATSGATIEDVGLTNVNISGQNNTGGLVGNSAASSIISNSYVNGTVTGSSNVGGLVGQNSSAVIINSFATAMVTGSGNDIGGLVGNSNTSSTISNSYATGAVGGGSHTGGLVGDLNASSVLYSYASGIITGTSELGGLVGNSQASSNISNSYARGGVTAIGSDAGGLVGSQQSSTISNSYAIGTASAGSHAGGLVGNNNTTATVSNSYATGIASSTSDSNATAGGLIGTDDGTNTLTNNWWYNANNSNGVANNGAAAGVNKASAVSDFYGTGGGTGGAVYSNLGVPIWDLTGLWSSNATYPTLVWQSMGTGGFTGGTSIDPFQIFNVNQLQFMEYDLSAYYTLENNIDASATSTWNYNGSVYAGFMPIGNSSSPFTGNLSANFDIIDGLYINRPSTDDVGLFGETLGGRISRAVLNHINITGHNDVGGIVGKNDSPSIFNLSKISGSYTSGSVMGSSNVGGLAGENTDNSTISGSQAMGNVTGSGNNVGGLVGNNNLSAVISDSDAIASVTGVNNVGGLIGQSSSGGDVNNTYATGNVLGSGDDVGGLIGQNGGDDIISSYATGTVSGGNEVGGLIGLNSNSNILQSYGSGSVAGSGNDAGGLVGLLNGSTISYSYANGGVRGSNEVGGLVGNSQSSSISNSYSTGAVTASGNDAGGLAGNLQSSDISKSYAIGATKGSVKAGGLVGNNNTSSIVSNSYATGVSTTTSDSNATAGGLIGNDDGTNTLTNNWWYNASNSNGVANNAVAAGVNKASAASDFYGIGSGTGGAVYSSSGVPIWDLTGLWFSNATYPTLVWQGMGASNYIGGSFDTPFQIFNVNQLQFMEYDLSAYYTLENNINAAATSTWNYDGSIDEGFVPLGNVVTPFSGTFLGNSKIIDNLFINRPTTDDVGLFGVTQTGTAINDVSLTHVNITGQNNVGGLAGENFSNSITVPSTISNSSVSGSVMGNSNVGGLVGQNVSSSITNSFAAGSVTGIANNVGGLVGNNNNTHSAISGSYATGNVSGSSEVGGLIGAQSSNTAISGVYATGNVIGSGNVGGLIGQNTSAAISSSHATGNVTGSGDDVGGLIGQNNTALSASYATGTVGGGNDVGGLVGLNSFSTISQSYGSGDVTGSGNNAGGLVGYLSNSTASLSYASGDIAGNSEVGGLVGNSQTSNVANSYASGDVTASGSDAGGLVGNEHTSTILRSYAIGTTSASNNAGGLVGSNNTNSTLSNSYATGVASSTSDANATAGGLIGNDDGTNPLTNNWWYNASNGNGVANNAAAAGVNEAGALSDFYGLGSGTGGAVYASWDFVTIPNWDSFAGINPHLHWEHYNPGINISGNAFSDLGLTGLGAGISIDLIINGAPDGTVTTSAGGAFNFSGIVLSADDMLLLYISGNVVKGSTVTQAVASRTDITGLNIYGNSLLLRSESNTPLINSSLSTAQGAISDPDTLYSLTGGNLAVNSGIGLIIDANQTFIPGQNLTLQGDGAGLTIRSGATFSAGSNTVTIPGNFTNLGTFNSETSAMIFNQAAGTQKLISGNSDFYDIQHAGAGTLQLMTDNLTVDDSFTNAAGIFDANGLTNTVTNSAAITGGSYLAGLGTQSFNAGLTISGGSFVGSGGDVDTTDLTLSGGTLTATSGAFDVSGNWAVSGGTFIPGSNTVVFNGSGTQLLDSGNQHFYNLTDSGTGTLMLNNNNLTVAGAFNNSSGTFDAHGLSNAVAGSTTISGGTYQASSAAQRFAGGLTINGGTFTASIGNISAGSINESSGTFTGSTGTIMDNGAFSLSGGTFTAPSGVFVVDGNWLQSGGVFAPGGNTVTFDGAGTQTFDSGGTSFDNITHSGSGTLQLTSALTLANGGYTFSNSDGTFDLNGNSWTMTGNNFSNQEGNLQLIGTELISGLVLDVNHGTVTYDGGSVYNGIELGNIYNNLTFKNSSGVWNLNSALTVKGSLDLSAGTVNAVGPMTISVGKNWSNTGTFNAGTSSVILDGANQAINGTTSFYNLQKISDGSTLTFESGDEQTVTGLLDLEGTPAHLLKIRSTTKGVQSKLNVVHKPTLAYLDIEDSNATGPKLDCITGCLDLGNNTNWFIPMQENINHQISVEYGFNKNQEAANGWIYILSTKLSEIYESGMPYGGDTYIDLTFKKWLNNLEAAKAVQTEDGVELISSVPENTQENNFKTDAPAGSPLSWRDRQEINAGRALDAYEVEHREGRMGNNSSLPNPVVYDTAKGNLF